MEASKQQARDEPIETFKTAVQMEAPLPEILKIGDEVRKQHPDVSLNQLRDEALEGQ